MRRVVWAVVGLIGLAIAAPSRAETPAHCEATNRLCRHLSTVFAMEAHGYATVRRWEEDGAILYTAIGLPSESDQIFSDLLEALGKRAGLTMRRAAANEIRHVRIIAVGTDDPAVRSNAKRISDFVGANVTIEEATKFADNSRAFLLYRPRYGARSMLASEQGLIQRCAMYLRLSQLRSPEVIGFVMASEIYQCLTGFRPSNAVTSLLNTKIPTSLVSPPYARLSSLDAAILRVLYEPGDALFGEQHAELIPRLEARLRTEGFDDDGNKR